VKTDQTLGRKVDEIKGFASTCTIESKIH